MLPSASSAVPSALAGQRREDVAQQRRHAPRSGLVHGFAHDVDAEDDSARARRAWALIRPGPQPMSSVGPDAVREQGPVGASATRAQCATGSGLGLVQPDHVARDAAKRVQRTPR